MASIITIVRALHDAGVAPIAIAQRCGITVAAVEHLLAIAPTDTTWTMLGQEGGYRYEHDGVDVYAMCGQRRSFYCRLANWETTHAAKRLADPHRRKPRVIDEAIWFDN